MLKKSVFLSSSLRFLTPLVSVCLVKLLNARGPGVYADYLVFFGYITIIGVIGSLGLNSSYVRSFAKQPDVGYKSFLSVSAKPFLYTLILVAFQVMIVGLLDDLSIGYLVFLFLASLAKIWYDITAEVSFVFNKLIGAIGAHTGPLVVFCLGIIWLEHHSVLILYVFSYVLSLFIIHVLSFFVWTQHDMNPVEIVFNVRLYIVPILSTLASQMFIVLRGYLSLTDESLVTLGILARVGSVLTLTLSMFNVVLAPRFAEKNIVHAWQFFKKMLGYNFIIVTLLFFGANILLDEIFVWFAVDNALGVTWSSLFLFSFFVNAITGPIGVFAVMTGGEDLSVRMILSAILLMLLSVLLLGHRPTEAIVTSYLVYSIVANGGLLYMVNQRINV